MTPEEFNNVFNLPFKEASGFFRQKLNIPTDKWDDLWLDQHAKGFMVAGANKAGLLADFRGAVQKSIDGSMTLPQFQSKFDEIVTRHGWSYNGSRNWRSELIYNTNVRTAFNAGRWQQLTDVPAGQVVYLVYRHRDGVRHPRPWHVAWDGITLPATHPWWQTHFTPNGWGCHCTVYRATAAEYHAAVAAGKVPPADMAIDPKTGAPFGIDKGWDYNVGQASDWTYKILGDKFEELPNDISRAWMKEHVQGPAFERFFTGKITGEFPVAVLHAEDIQAVPLKRCLDEAEPAAFIGIPLAHAARTLLGWARSSRINITIGWRWCFSDQSRARKSFHNVLNARRPLISPRAATR